MRSKVFLCCVELYLNLRKEDPNCVSSAPLLLLKNPDRTLGSYIFHCLWVSQWGNGVTWKKIHCFNICKCIQALYWQSTINSWLVPPYTDSVAPSTNYCCPILTQYTASSPRNTQLSQLDLVVVVCRKWWVVSKSMLLIFLAALVALWSFWQVGGLFLIQRQAGRSLGGGGTKTKHQIGVTVTICCNPKMQNKHFSSITE